MAERRHSLEELSQAQRDLNPNFVSVTFCYLCNARTLTPRRTDGTNPPKRLDPQGQLSRNFIDESDLDIYTVACEHCDSAFQALPTPSYFVPAVPLYPSVGYHAPFLTFGDGRPEFSPGQNSGVERPRLEPLYQDWLVFGLLEEFLGDLYVRGHEVAALDQLLQLLPDWIRLRRQPADRREAVFAHLNECLVLVFQKLQQRNQHGLSFDEDLCCLIATIGELLTTAMKIAFPDPEYAGELNRVFAAFMSKSLIFNRLKELGWCIYDARRVAPNRSLSEIFLYMNLDRSSIKFLHQHCTRSRCEEHDIQTQHAAQGGPSHFNCSGSCRGAIGFDSAGREMMIAILKQNEIPLVKIEVDPKGNAIAIAVEKATQGRDYVAISHVWSQGLGNHNDNSLMQCQLTRLHLLVSSIRDIYRRGTMPLLWIDTLCSPVRDRDAKKAAIKLMKQTYRKATAVIVLDAELEKHETSKSAPLELFARVIASAWMARLWTLQEGAEPGSLWIKFADRILNIWSMFLALRWSHRSINLRERLTATCMLANFQNIRVYPMIDRQTLHRDEILHLLSAVQHRRVWKPTNEAACLGQLFRLDMDRLFEGSENARMQRLWDQLSECGLVSRELVFYAGSKMTVPGYRWALTTLLQNGASNAFLWSHITPAKVTTEGLEISSRGGLIDLSAGAVQPLIENEVLQLRDPSGRRGRLFPMDEVWERNFQLPERKRPTLGNLLQDAKKRFALLPKHANGFENDHRNNNGLLVELIGPVTDSIVCLGKRLVAFRLYSQEQSDAQDRAGIAFHGTIKEWLPPTQLWRID